MMRHAHVLWKSPGTTGCLLATPRGIVLPNEILDPDTGRRRAGTEGMGRFPALHGERIVSISPPGLVAHDVSSGRKTAEWIAVSPRFDELGFVDFANGVVSAHAWSGERIWSRPCGRVNAITHARVYVDDAALDRGTGRELWKHPSLEFVASDDAGVVCRPRGWDQPLVSLDADGAELWRMEGGWDKSVLALSPGLVVGAFEGYDRNPPGFFILDRRTGARAGRVEDDVRGARIVRDAIYAHDDGSVSAYATTGERRWRLEIPAREIAAFDGRVYVSGPDGSVTCLSDATSSPR